MNSNLQNSIRKDIKNPFLRFIYNLLMNRKYFRYLSIIIIIIEAILGILIIHFVPCIELFLNN